MFRLIQLALIGLCSFAASRLDLYPPPPELKRAPEFKVKINGRDLFVYNVPAAAVAYFSFSGKVPIEIESSRAVERVDVRPKSLKIRPEVRGNTIRFKLSRPAHLSVEVNGDIRRPLLVFANPPEANPPKPGDPGVRYFEGGKVHETGRIVLKSGESLYIAGGAVVRGSVFMDQAENVKVLGRGILEGSLYKPQQSRMIEVDRSSDVLLDGIIVADSKHWTIPLMRSDRVRLHNVKIVSGNNWDDGVDVVGSQDVVIERCFIRTKDDCIAVKSGVTYFTKFDAQRDVRNVTVKDSVLWNAEWGNGIEIGFETRTESISGIRFLNIDLIHVEGPEGTFTIHNGDRANVRDVLYEDIRVEDSHGLLVDFKVLKSRYSRDAQRGSVKDVRFRKIRVEGRAIPSLLIGFDDAHRIEGVTFDDFRVLGKRWKSLADGQFKTEHAQAITFR